MDIRFFGGILYRTYFVVLGYLGGISSRRQRFPQSRDPVLFIFGPQSLLWSLDTVDAHGTEKQTEIISLFRVGSLAQQLTFWETCSLGASMLPCLPHRAGEGHTSAGWAVARAPAPSAAPLRARLCARVSGEAWVTGEGWG